MVVGDIRRLELGKQCRANTEKIISVSRQIAFSLQLCSVFDTFHYNRIYGWYMTMLVVFTWTSVFMCYVFVFLKG